MSSEFAQQFCARFAIPPVGYREAMMRRTLYPLARLLRPILVALDHDFFAADHSFVDGIGRATQRQTLETEIHEFANHPDNRRFMRREFRFRVPARRVRKVFNQVFPAGTLPPQPRLAFAPKTAVCRRSLRP